MIAGTDGRLRVFTTRPDTLFGATYMVVSPEHPLLEKYADRIRNMDEVRAYQRVTAAKSDMERTELGREKTGVRLEGLSAVNPVNGQEIPIFISDYVLMSSGTGALMAVPGHDVRDWEFARVFGLPIVEVVAGGNVEEAAYTDIEQGVLVNSGILNGMDVPRAKEAIIRWLEERGMGKRAVNYKLRDWVFSRQRYWGEPIPLVECPACGWVPLPDDQLPLKLPEVSEFKPGECGESPLAALDGWVNTVCPRCGGPARRETDTMPQWAGSSWYFLRYTDPRNDRALASAEALRYWLPVDWYNGGMEHTTLHLLYSVLAQVPLRHRDGAHARAIRPAHQSWHDPGRERGQDEQVPRQCHQSRRYGARLRSRRLPHLRDVHGRIRPAHSLVHPGSGGLPPFP
jgi:leucyl-tRNA synthetase